MKKEIKLFTIVSCSLLSSCKEKDSIESKVKEIPKPITYTINFPDTVYVNQPNDGIIHYKGALDTIITTFGDRYKHRYTRFILITGKNLNYDVNQLKSIIKDTFGALNNREIPFYDIKFTEEGVYYIDGVINDIVLLDTIKDSKPEDEIELVQNEVRVTRKVIVVSDKPNK